MARIKYVLNERRIAARQAQELVVAATAGSAPESSVGSDKATPPANFMEEEVPKSASTQSAL